MAELAIGDVAEPEIALDDLDEIEADAAANAMGQVVDRRQDMKRDEEQGEGVLDCGDSNVFHVLGQGFSKTGAKTVKS